MIFRGAFNTDKVVSGDTLILSRIYILQHFKDSAKLAIHVAECKAYIELMSSFKKEMSLHSGKEQSLICDFLQMVRFF